jgi:hypothetical protein
MQSYSSYFDFEAERQNLAPKKKKKKMRYLVAAAAVDYYFRLKAFSKYAMVCIMVRELLLNRS